MHLLQVLSALEENADRAQRAIAQATGLSLAKVNFCLKKLVAKGHVKLRNVARNPNKLGYLYLLTPEGVKAKSQLTYSFVRQAAAQYNAVYGKVLGCIEEIAAAGATDVVFLGTGDVAEVCYDALSRHGRLKLRAVLDDRHQGSQFRGHPVKPERSLQEVSPRVPVLLCDPDLLRKAKALVGDRALHVLR